jgi:hypothetical protein
MPIAEGTGPLDSAITVPDSELRTWGKIDWAIRHMPSSFSRCELIEVSSQASDAGVAKAAMFFMQSIRLDRNLVDY